MPEPRTCGNCEHARIPPDAYTAPGRCAKSAAIDIDILSIQHPQCPLRPACPPLGITLQAPWTAMVAWGGKRVENRHAAVAQRLRSYRRRIALTGSAQYKMPDDRRVEFYQARGARRWLNGDVARLMAYTLREHQHCAAWQGEEPSLTRIASLAGKWFATASVSGILSPAQNTGPWAVPGQWGIVLRDISVLTDPEPATGGQGVFGFGRCQGCGRAVATGSRHTCARGTR